MAFLTLKEAADYARFACAAYAVFEYEDQDKMDDKGKPIEGHCAHTCGICKPKSNLKTYATVIRSSALQILLPMAWASRHCAQAWHVLMSTCCLVYVY